MNEVLEAPYNFIYDVVTVEGKQVKVFRLGEYGKKMLENAINKETFREGIKELREIIDTLIQVIGGRDRLIQHFKEDFLKRIGISAKHRSDLVTMPFWFEKTDAYKQLLEEKKIYYSPKGGWIKLTPEKEA